MFQLKTFTFNFREKHISQTWIGGFQFFSRCERNNDRLIRLSEPLFSWNRKFWNSRCWNPKVNSRLLMNKSIQRESIHSQEHHWINLHCTQTIPIPRHLSKHLSKIKTISYLLTPQGMHHEQHINESSSVTCSNRKVNSRLLMNKSIQRESIHSLPRTPLNRSNEFLISRHFCDDQRFTKIFRCFRKCQNQRFILNYIQLTLRRSRKRYGLSQPTKPNRLNPIFPLFTQTACEKSLEKVISRNWPFP
jgi:hypothetical protein